MSAVRYRRPLIAGSVAVLTLGACAVLTPRETLRSVPAGVRLPVFEEVTTSFTHRWDKDHGYPFSGAAVIDVDGDGRFEVVVGGGFGQDDAVLRYDAEARALVAHGGGWTLKKSGAATYGLTALDIDDDGDTDLLAARDDGVTLYRNTGTALIGEPVAIELAKDAVPYHVAVGDPDGDADADLYVSTFVSASAFKSATFNDPDHAKPNHLLKNDGGTFVDVTDAVSRGTQNCFMAAFVDLDGDGHQDLVLSNNTGEVQLLQGEGSFKFEDVPTHSGHGFWMALGIADIDHDQDPDLFFSNAGNTVPSLFTVGDIGDGQRREDRWAILRNDSTPGAIAVTPLSAELGLDDVGFGWGGLFEDVNLDGAIDLLVAQNYIKWPVHKAFRLPGKVLLASPDDASAGGGGYYAAEVMTNEHFGQSPITVDLDGDGRHDILWLNQNGPLRAFLNKTPVPGIVVVLEDNARAHGAVVTAMDARGATTTWFSVSGTGLLTDPAPSFSFSTEPEVRKIVVRYRDGLEQTLNAPAAGVHLVKATAAEALSPE